MKHETCFCCWHYSPLEHKCTYWENGDNYQVNADDNCHFPEEDAFDNVCEFEDIEDKAMTNQWAGENNDK